MGGSVAHDAVASATRLPLPLKRHSMLTWTENGERLDGEMHSIHLFSDAYTRQVEALTQKSPFRRFIQSTHTFAQIIPMINAIQPHPQPSPKPHPQLKSHAINETTNQIQTPIIPPHTVPFAITIPLLSFSLIAALINKAIAPATMPRIRPNASCLLSSQFLLNTHNTVPVCIPSSHNWILQNQETRRPASHDTSRSPFPRCPSSHAQPRFSVGQPMYQTPAPSTQPLVLQP